jgi:metallophosphoesterase (TIGR03768 family)
MPSSGAHVGADFIDYQKPFQAAGLDREIPWYQTIGNHDHFWIGSFPISDFLRQSYISDTCLAMGDVIASPANINKADYYMGLLDGTTPYGDIIDAGPVANFGIAPKVIADPKRHSLTMPEWMDEFFKTSSLPLGHGFNKTSANDGFACYSFNPKSSVPIKVIVLDDTQRDDDGFSGIHGHGFLDQMRFDWLMKELADGQAAGQLMIIAAHIPIGVEALSSELGWWTDPRNAVTQQDLIKKLQSHPNVILWVAGHRHCNTVKAFASKDLANHPENGFWQVETASLRDFPQQFRTFEIYLNSDYTISIVTTNIDPAVKNKTPAAISRSFAIATQQIVGHQQIYQNPSTLPDASIKPMPTGSYNAELIKQLSPDMEAKMRKLYPISK